MKRNAKFLTVLLSLVLVLAMALTGCNPTTPDQSGKESAGNSQSADGGQSTGGGTTEVAVTNSAELINVVSSVWGGEGYMKIKKDGWSRLFNYYSGLQSTPSTAIDWNSLTYNKASDLTYTPDTTLRMATGYNSALTGITFKPDDKISLSENGSIKLADGQDYAVGDLKPTWKQLSDTLDIKFTDVYTGKSATKEYNVWKDKLVDVDMVAGPATTLNTDGAAGKLVDLSQHLDKMPYFKAYLDANPIVKLSIMGSVTGTNKGAMYFSPYFDGVDDIERMPLMRTDFLAKLLDGEGDFTASASKNLAAVSYTPYMPTTGTVVVDVVSADGSATEKLTKNYGATNGGNIVALMNSEINKGEVNGVKAVNMLRNYIDVTYNKYYGTTRSNLFCGQNAAWDADELVALLRCVVANPQTLNGTDTIQGLFSRDEGNNQRRVDLFRFAGSLFGVRGLESRSDYLYFDVDGALKDARQEADTYVAIEKMNALYKEGLISSDYNKDGATSKSDTYILNDTGFMSYDYNQTQTVLNKTKLNGSGADKTDTGEKYMAVMVPVANWKDGTNLDATSGADNGVYMRFTESWRSVKTDAWALSKAGIGNDTNKLNAALAIIDYAYSPQGQILMSYGPDAFIDVKDANGTTIETKYNTFNFNGKKMPKVKEATLSELWEKSGGNYTNYARQFLGSTLSFVKSQAFEYQCTHEVGIEGASKISVAIGFGTINHPKLTVDSNMWYTSIPTVLPNTVKENTILDGYTNLMSSGKFSQTSGKTNVFVNIITGGYSGSGVTITK